MKIAMIGTGYVYVQFGDVPATWADASLFRTLTRCDSYIPQTHFEDGVAHFVDWYRGYYDVVCAEHE